MSAPSTNRSRILTLVAAFLGWMFDGFEMGLFPLIGQPALKDLLGEASHGSLGHVTVRIGEENSNSSLRSTSVVASTYGSRDDAWAALGIVGPTRMDYPSTMASVRAVARYVGRFLAEG